MEQKILDVIKEAEVILVGIGEEFVPSYPEWQTAELNEYERAAYCAELSQDADIFKAYGKLRDLLKGKPYFIVTMNDDGLIYRSELPEDFIVSPCGNLSKMQCSEHIVDAGDIPKKILETGDKSTARCPVCGSQLSMHTVSVPGYLESGYLGQWEKYRNFLQGTLNHKVVLLELGVGFRFPQVVRLPFEKTTYYNKKAFLIRVNRRFPQLPEEVSDRGISVKSSPIQWLLEKE